LHCRDKFPKEKIPTLEEVVELCSSLELKMIIEIKKSTQALEVSYPVKAECFPRPTGISVYFKLPFFANLYLPRK